MAMKSSFKVAPRTAYVMGWELDYHDQDKNRYITCNVIDAS